MLAWIHQAMATERELLQALLKLCSPDGISFSWDLIWKMKISFYSSYHQNRSILSIMIIYRRCEKSDFKIYAVAGRILGKQYYSL